MSIFARTTPLDPNDPAMPLEAYKEGRKDERRQIEAGGPDHRVVKKEVDEAFERGRRHGRLERRGSVLGVLSFLALAVLVIGGAIMVVDYGSFGAAGSAIDRMTFSL
jgi:hypothetical protein